MNLFTQLLLCLVAAAAATFSIGQFGLNSPVELAAVIAAATLFTPILNQLLKSGSTADYDADADYDHDDEPPITGDREEGEVKWFNVSKGFGFIRRDNGEEIFVHFRSIREQGGRGRDGRRGLKDGQRVTYVVVDSDKGPQAEDVEGL